MNTKPKHAPLTAAEIIGTTPLDILDDAQLVTVSREFQAQGGKWHLQCSGYTCWLRSVKDRDNCHILPNGCTLDEALDLAQAATPMKPVLDACCGSRMFWFNRKDPRTLFVDKRKEAHMLKDKSSSGGIRRLDINPDIIADFTALPFPNDQFAMVVFDPPHLLRAGTEGWQAKKYGKLTQDWQNHIRMGFAECFRVLRSEGTLVFKWNEQEIPVSRILSLTPEKPLVGQRCGKTAKTHWLVFMKSPSYDHLI